VELLPREGIVSAKGDSQAGPSRGFLRRGPTYQDARIARSRSWVPAALGLFAAMAVAVLILGSTGIGRVAGRASEHFLLYYAGVFVLLTLTATVGIGLVATDRIIMSPARRVTAQAVHRAVATGALAFLVIHIISEIAAQRSQVIDSVIPFLDPGRTFYLGLGTVASDLMIMIAVTGIYRARLATNMSPAAWRVLHCTAYAAWLISIVHGLLAGRAAKSFFGFSGFVAWSYGGCVAAVGIALVVRLVAKDRANEHTIAQSVPDRPTPLWPAAAGAPALGQAGFGAPQVAISPARPYQRALPAPAGATTALASLPAGGSQIDDGGQFGQDDTRGQFAREEARTRFAEEDTRFAEEDARYAQEEVTRGRYAPDEMRGGYRQENTLGRYARDETRGRYGQEETRVSYAQDDARSRYADDDVRGGYADDARGGYADDDVRGGYGQDDARGGYADDDVRVGYVVDDAPGGYADDDARGGYGPYDLRGRYAEEDLRGRSGQDDMRGGYGQEMRGGYPEETRGGYGPEDVRGGYGPDDMRGGYGK
jgi:DMSO/TMAO reductase YedYZ heme-binding membrane subunit